MILKEVTKFEPSSWHGTTIHTTPQHLIDLADKWGIPYNDFNDGSDKTNFDFDFQAKKLKFTVYDWKEYEVLEMNREYCFHIGGRNGDDTDAAKDILTKILENE